MFFALSKTLSLLALPSNFLVLMALAGLALRPTRWRVLGSRILAVAVILIALIGFLPFGNLLALSLENRFPRTALTSAPDGIVVLGGAIDADLSSARGEPVIGASIERLTAAAALARAYPNARIVYSGGSGNLFGGGVEADVAARFLSELGVQATRIERERESRNTFENAVFSKALAMPKPGQRWLLVTSAAHMPRAIGCFRQAGFPVEAYPADWQTGGGWKDLWQPPVVSGGLSRLDAAAREWIGLIAYFFTGKTSALLPAP